MWGKKDDPATTGDVTGSISPAPMDNNLTESDLALTRNAVSDILSRGSKDASQPWENPQTGARGSVTPLASAYQSPDGRTCRDFLASYVRGGNEGWLQGEACRGAEGSAWEIRGLKPWRRS
jgi:surface antigen